MSIVNFLDAISVYEAVFTKSELKLYLYLKTHIHEIMYMSVTDLAKQIGIGESTILRFCRKVGFEGYLDFKINIAQHQGGVSLENEIIANGSLYMTVAESLISSIKKASKLIDDSVLIKAVTMINQANRVLFFGVGSSGVAALEAKHRFMRLGRKYDAFTDSHFMMMMSSTLGPGDLVIGFSLSGATIDTIDACEKARAYGSNVIAVTSYVQSALTKIADLTILTSGKEGPFEGGSLFAKISQLYIIDLLFTYSAQSDLESTHEYMSRIAKSISEKTY
jgi:DNA-binding MurR/RpiR family transcriptional regulator